MIDSSALELRQQAQAFFRAFGLLAGDRTPCGKPISISEAHALMELGRDHDAPRNMRDLGERLCIDKSNVSRLCQRLSRSGHLRIQPSPLDGRVRELSLTARGVRLASEVERASLQRFQSLVSALPAGGARAAIDALAALRCTLVQSATEQRAA